MIRTTYFNEDFIQSSMDGHEDVSVEAVGPLEILMLEEEYEDGEDALDHMRSANITC